MSKKALSVIAERIIASEKKAVREITEFVWTKRKMNLTPPEAHHIVALSRNTPNWETLRGLAEQGRAMPVGDGLEPVVSSIDLPEPDDVSTLRPIGQKLKSWFKENWDEDECNYSPKEKWASEVYNEDPPMPYWCWVAKDIIEENAMMPWDRVASEAFQLAEKSKMVVNYDYPFGWMIDGKIRYGEVGYGMSFKTEKEGWEAAAEVIKNRSGEQVVPRVRYYYNNIGCKTTCPCCNESFKPSISLAPFLLDEKGENTWNPVCWECIELNRVDVDSPDGHVEYEDAKVAMYIHADPEPMRKLGLTNPAAKAEFDQFNISDSVAPEVGVQNFDKNCPF